MSPPGQHNNGHMNLLVTVSVHVFTVGIHVSTGQHNDARMNLAIGLTAARYGAAVANYTEVVRLLKTSDSGEERVCGARCRDVLTGEPPPRVGWSGRRDDPDGGGGGVVETAVV